MKKPSRQKKLRKSRTAKADNRKSVQPAGEVQVQAKVECMNPFRTRSRRHDGIAVTVKRNNKEYPTCGKCWYLVGREKSNEQWSSEGK